MILLAAAPDKPDVMPSLVSGTLTLIGTAVTVFIGWVKERDLPAKRTRVLDEATKRVAFWKSWLEALTLFSATPEQIGAWTKQARCEIEEASALVDGLYRKQVGRQVSAWRRWLLFFKPHGAIEWCLHVMAHGNQIVALFLFSLICFLPDARSDKGIWLWFVMNLGSIVLARFLTDPPQEASEGLSPVGASETRPT